MPPCDVDPKSRRANRLQRLCPVESRRAGAASREPAPRSRALCAAPGLPRKSCAKPAASPPPWPGQAEKPPSRIAGSTTRRFSGTGGSSRSSSRSARGDRGRDDSSCRSRDRCAAARGTRGTSRTCRDWRPGGVPPAPAWRDSSRRSAARRCHRARGDDGRWRTAARDRAASRPWRRGSSRSSAPRGPVRGARGRSCRPGDRPVQRRLRCDGRWRRTEGECWVRAALSGGSWRR